MMFSFNCGRSLIGIGVILMCIASNLFSYTYLGLIPPGDPVRGYSARTSAMGNISAACIENTPNMYFNPASLAYVTDRQLSLSLNYIPAEERIITEDQAPLLNFNSYTLGSISLSLPLKTFVVGFGIVPLNDMQYKAEKKTYVSSVLRDYTKTENTGTLYSWIFSGAHKIGIFSLGLGLNFLTAEYETRIESYDFQYRKGSSAKTQNKLDGSNFTVSCIFEVSKRTLLGFSYIQETELNKKDNSKLKLPAQSTLSTTINIESSVLAFELILTENKKTEFHLGVEHFTEGEKWGTPIRYGFGFVPHPADDKYYSFLVTAGSGFKISKNIFLDFSSSYETTIINILNAIFIQQNTYKLLCSTKFLF